MIPITGPRLLALGLVLTAISLAVFYGLHLLDADPVERPLRVLYVGEVNPTGSGTDYAYLPGQTLAPEAIYFDHCVDPSCLTPSYLRHFDVAVLALAEDDLAPEQRRALDRFRRAGGGIELLGSNPPVEETRLRERVIEAVSAKRRAGWEAFLADREPLRYERRSDIPNYERRPEPLPYQLPLSPEESMKYIQVPADFELRLFAAEPDIFKPIAMAWDERGRLWIAETRDYPHNLEPEGGNDQIKILEDTNGDGRADRFTVFADGLSIPTSLVFADGGIIVSQAPHFLFLKDTTGDDRADVREVLFENMWGTFDTHAGPSSLAWGLDNWLYGALGYSGFQGEVDGKVLQFREGIYRFKPNGSKIEFLHQFTNNTWGFGQNAAGEVFGSTANNAPSFFGGLSLTHMPAGRRLMSAKRINTFDRVHPNTPNIRQVDVIGGWTAAAGHTFTYSDALPERLQGMALIGEPTAHLLGIFDVQRDGAGYAAHDGFNLLAASDEWVSPVFADVGPDGAVWVADWYSFIIQHNPAPTLDRAGYEGETGPGNAHVNPNRDHERGRIYRIVWKDGRPTPIRSLAGASTSDLVEALDSDNRFWRLTAQRLLVEGARSEAAGALRKMVRAEAGRAGALHALWTLHALGELDRDTHHATLLSRDPALRRNAVRALGNGDEARLLFFESGVVHDPDLTTRLAALVKLAEFPTTEDIRTVVGRLLGEPDNREDEWLSEALELLGGVHDVRGYAEGPNLLPSPSFEILDGRGVPQGWTLRRLPGDLRYSRAGGPEARSGGSAVRFDWSTSVPPAPALSARVPVEPNTRYRLSAWIRNEHSGGAGGRVGIGELERRTDPISRRTPGWNEVELFFDSGDLRAVTVEVGVSGDGDSRVWFDDVSLAEVTDEGEAPVTAGDPERGRRIFYTHELAACSRCHAVDGQGGTIGPALDGIGARKSGDYILESLLDPNATMAEGYDYAVSPMPPAGVLLRDQEIEDLLAFLLTLKE